MMPLSLEFKSLTAAIGMGCVNSFLSLYQTGPNIWKYLSDMPDMWMADNLLLLIDLRRNIKYFVDA